MEILNGHQDGKACLIVELTNKVEGNCIDGSFFEITLARDKSMSDEQCEELELYKPLYVAIREEGIKGAAREISDKMANPRYAFKIDYDGEMGGNTELNMFFFDLVLKVSGDLVENKQSICQAVQSNFNVVKCLDGNDELRFTIRGIHGEGPCVYTIGNIISVASDNFGPAIDSRMAAIGLTDYKVIFTVNRWI